MNKCGMSIKMLNGHFVIVACTMSDCYCEQLLLLLLQRSIATVVFVNDYVIFVLPFYYAMYFSCMILFFTAFCCCVDFQVHLKRCCMQQQQHSIVSLVTVYFYVYMSTSTRMLVLWGIQHAACAYILCYSLWLLHVACHTQMPHSTVAIYK